jgi:hypothetical protein
VDCEEINMHINNKEPTSHNKWSIFASNHPSKSNKARSFVTLQTMQPILMANHYSTLSNLQKTSKLSVKSTTLEHHETACMFSKHHKRNNDLRRNRNPATKHHSVSSFQHPPEFNPNKVRCKFMSKRNDEIMTSEKDKD